MHKIFGTDRIDGQFMPKPACAISKTGISIPCSHTPRMDQNKDSDQILRLLAPPDSSAWSFHAICDKKQTLIYWPLLCTCSMQWVSLSNGLTRADPGYFVKGSWKSFFEIVIEVFHRRSHEPPSRTHWSNGFSRWSVHVPVFLRTLIATCNFPGEGDSRSPQPPPPDPSMLSGHGRSTIMQKRICVYIWTENMGLVYPCSDGFLMIRIQNMCGKAILMCLVPILVGFIYDSIICSKTPFKGFSTH